MGCDPCGYGPFSDEIMNAADRCSNSLWNTIIRDYHEKVSESTHDSFLVYHTIFNQSLIKLTEVLDLTHVVEQMAIINNVCQWDSLSEQALEFFYLDGEVEEYLDDETEHESIRLAVWADIGFSCLYQIVHHLRNIRVNFEKDSEDFSNYSHIISAYREICQMLIEAIEDCD